MIALPPGGVPVWLLNLGSHGALGVPLFFVLSGFILTHRYLRPTSGPLEKQAFWVARFSRVYPLFLVSLLMQAPLYIIEQLQKYSPAETLGLTAGTGLLMASTLHVWFVRTEQIWNAPAWSLSAEMFYYAVFPVVSVLATMRSARVGWMIVVACWLLAVAAPMSIMGVSLTTLVYLPHFLLGILVGRAFIRTGSAQQPAMGPLPLGPLLAAGAAIVILLATMLVTVEWTTRMLGTERVFLHLLVWPCGLLVYGLALGGGPLAKLLASRPMLRLGEASYAVYILQWPVWYWLQLMVRGESFMQPMTEMPTLAFFAGYVVILVGISILSYLTIERPARQAIRRMYVAHQRQRTTPPLAAQAE
jgi:peptidoglycan/LPS O-acetylase OafA/YrhL